MKNINKIILITLDNINADKHQFYVKVKGASIILNSRPAFVYNLNALHNNLCMIIMRGEKGHIYPSIYKYCLHLISIILSGQIYPYNQHTFKNYPSVRRVTQNLPNYFN